MQKDEDVDQKGATAVEIAFHMKTVLLDRTVDSHKWWLANAKQCPNLAEFAKHYLSSPCSSIVRGYFQKQV